MKNLCLLFSVLASSFIFSQTSLNQSLGTVQTSISTPTPAGSGEIFRFRSGSVRQLDAGSSFDFTNSRWFSLGSVNTGSQTVYGLRFQLPNKSLILGYQDIGDVNPRIQWISGPALIQNSDLEFRASTSFTSTNSNLVATMKSNGNTVFGIPALFSSSSKVSIENSNQGRGLFIRSGFGFSGRTPATGIGLEVQQSFGGNSRIGIKSSTNSVVDFEASIYAETSNNNGNQYAGFFDGDTVITGGIFSSSDEKLKENIEDETNVLERLALLRPVTYDYKKGTALNTTAQKQHGFIAQELELVFPELTKDVVKPIFDEKGEITSNYSFKTINYNGLISMLTSAVNDLNNEVVLLKKELDNLKNNAAKEATTEDVLEDLNNVPTLEQNIPNPFSDKTTIKYSLSNSGANSSIIIFDMSGKIIKEIALKQDKGELTVTADQIGKGLFIYSLVQNGQELASKRMIIK